jgi:hypothetical protein
VAWRWFSLGTPTSSTTKTGHHDIAEILLSVELNTKNQIKSNHITYITFLSFQDENKSAKILKTYVHHKERVNCVAWIKKYPVSGIVKC